MKPFLKWYTILLWQNRTQFFKWYLDSDSESGLGLVHLWILMGPGRWGYPCAIPLDIRSQKMIDRNRNMRYLLCGSSPAKSVFPQRKWRSYEESPRETWLHQHLKPKCIWCTYLTDVFDHQTQLQGCHASCHSVTGRSGAHAIYHNGLCEHTNPVSSSWALARWSSEK